MLAETPAPVSRRTGGDRDRGRCPRDDRVLAERFDHILYTGNGGVGRIVMRAAAEHLTPVTLELGGKSPAIVAGDANLEVAAKRIAWGKFTNAGQTCVAPDYVLVHRDVEDEFLGDLLRAIHDFYGEDPHASPDYGRIVNDRHFDRLVALLDGGGYEAVVTGGDHKRDDRYIAPTVLAGVSPDAAVMGEEIFGPILPVLVVDDLDEAIRLVNDGATSRSPSTCSASTCRPPSGSSSERRPVASRSTTTMMHVGVNELPFGGVGASGIGAYHGRCRVRHVQPQSIRARQAHQTGSLDRLPAIQAVEGNHHPPPVLTFSSGLPQTRRGEHGHARVEPTGRIERCFDAARVSAVTTGSTGVAGGGFGVVNDADADLGDELTGHRAHLRRRHRPSAARRERRRARPATRPSRVAACGRRRGARRRAAPSSASRSTTPTTGR